MLAKIEIDDSKCKGCGLCAAACPRKLLELGEEANEAGFTVAIVICQEKCAGCAFCASMCPAVAITVYSRQKNEYTGRLGRKFEVYSAKVTSRSG